MKDVSPSHGIDWASVMETTVTGRRTDWLTDGDILFAARGSNNYAVLLENCPEQTVASPHFFLIRGKSNAVLPAFLAWFLNRAPTSRYFQREAEGTRTLSIRRSVLENTPISVPSPEKQQQIVALHVTLRREQQIAEQLMLNGQSMMDAIAANLLQQTFSKG